MDLEEFVRLFYECDEETQEKIIRLLTDCQSPFECLAGQVSI